MYDEEAPGVWTWLQAWYAMQCDGEWEHGYGVEIETLDNPGWSLEIDLAGTSLAGRVYERQVVHRGEYEWVEAWAEHEQSHAACGPLDLGEALHLFQRTWIRRADAPGRNQERQIAVGSVLRARRFPRPGRHLDLHS